MIEIQTALEKDLPVIQKLAKKIWPVAYGKILSAEQLEYMLKKIYSIPSLTEQLNTFHHCFYLALEGGTPIGFASVSKDEENSSIFVLQKIYVLPDQQGKHIGNALLDKAKNHAIAGKGAALRLNVNRHNQAKSFYEKKGFKIIDKVDIDIGNGHFMNDYIMECNLAERSIELNLTKVPAKKP